MNEEKLFDKVNSFLALWNPIGVPDEIKYEEYNYYVPGLIIESKTLEKLKLKFIELIGSIGYEINDNEKIGISHKEIDELVNKLYQIINEHDTNNYDGELNLISTNYEKNIWLQEIENYSIKIFREFTGKYYRCGIFLENSKVNSKDFPKFITSIIDSGSVYFGFHGKYCEEAHDIADGEIHNHFNKLKREINQDNIILTLWQSDGNINEALFDVICLPSADEYFDSCNDVLIIAIGSSVYKNSIKSKLENLDDAFNGVYEK